MNPAAAWPWRALALIALAVAAALLLYDTALLWDMGWRALGFVDELDYGEGIVWQQARAIAAGSAYGEITGVPMIVFHYPPVYHVLTLIASTVTGMDMLAAGRLTSLLATLGIAVTGGTFVAYILREQKDQSVARLCGLAAALILFTVSPVRSWAALMRVDMVAVFFGLAGMWYGVRALQRPGLIRAAALCFVAAVYTKQTSLAAPTALFLPMLFVRPRLAWKGIVICVVLGLFVLGLLALVTEGGFLRHIFLYNINRFDLHRLKIIEEVARRHGAYLLMAGFALASGGAGLWTRRGTPLAARPGDFGFVVLFAYLLFSSATLILVAKSGAHINYFLEWTCALALLSGLGLVDVVRLVRRGEWPAQLWQRPFALLVLPLIAQGWLATEPFDMPDSPQRLEELEQLSRLVHDAQAPIISDDMVLLLRSGKPVVIEPAIAAELASMGVWDQRPFLRMIRAREFAFFVTVGDRGDAWFNSRYTSAVATAMAKAYPIKQRLGGYVVHWPLLGATR